MTSRLQQLLDAEPEKAARRDSLRAELDALRPPPLRFAIAMIGSSLPGDSGAGMVELRVLTGADVETVDPARIIFDASIDAETGIAGVNMSRGVWRPEMRAAYLEWMRGWYG